MQTHGGTIELDSHVGKGTTFRITLPAIESAVQERPAQETPARGEESLLIVEDDANVREIAVKMLSGLGYKAQAVCDEVEGLAAYDENRQEIDLVVTDIVLPRLGGRELAEALEERNPGVRVLFMSGYDRGQRQLQDLPRSGVGYLQKPFDLGQLARAVRSGLDGANRPSTA